MKAYGKDRKACANRKMRGTSRPCPCCIPKNGRDKTKDTKTAARRESKKAAQVDE